MLTIGTISVGEAARVSAYEGENGRVHKSEHAATFDKAGTLLARRYLERVAEPGGPGPWNTIFEMIEKDPDLFEAAVALARWKAVPR